MSPDQIEAVRAELIEYDREVFGMMAAKALHVIDYLTKANEELRAEVEEQARLNGMGAEHELSLRATIDRLTKERDEARAWHQASQEALADQLEARTKAEDQAEKFKWQVRDTCTRAEKAEAEVARLTHKLIDVGEMECGKCDAVGVDCGEHHPSWRWLATQARADLATLRAAVDELLKAQDVIDNWPTAALRAGYEQALNRRQAAFHALSTLRNLTKPEADHSEDILHMVTPTVEDRSKVHADLGGKWWEEAATTPIEPTDADLKAFGYAPGFYTPMCFDCTDEEKREGRMADKRAISCREHAADQWRVAQPEPEPEVDPLVWEVTVSILNKGESVVSLPELARLINGGARITALAARGGRVVFDGREG